MVLSKHSIYKRKLYGLKNTSYPLFFNRFFPINMGLPSKPLYPIQQKRIIEIGLLRQMIHKKKNNKNINRFENHKFMFRFRFSISFLGFCS